MCVCIDKGVISFIKYRGLFGNKTLIVYMDDIMVFCNSRAEVIIKLQILSWSLNLSVSWLTKIKSSIWL